MTRYALVLWLMLVSLAFGTHVHDFGAKGDAVTDDTQSFRDALAHAASTDGVLEFGPGRVYVLSSQAGQSNYNYSVPITVHTIRGVDKENPSTLLKKAGVFAADRVINAQWWLQEGDRPLRIENLKIDCNRDQQDWDGQWSRAHDGGIFVASQDKYGNMGDGRMQLTVRNVEIFDSAADGLYFGHHVDADIEHFKGRDNYRNCIGMGGKRCLIRLRHFEIDKLDVENNTVGVWTEIYVSDGTVRKEFDVAVTSADSVCRFERVHSLGYLTYLFNPGRTILRDCFFRIEVKDGDSKFSGLSVRQTGSDFLAEDTVFDVRRLSSTREPIRLRYSHKYEVEDRATFRRCFVRGDAGFQGPLIKADHVPNGRKVTVTIEHCAPVERWSAE